MPSDVVAPVVRNEVAGACGWGEVIETVRDCAAWPVGYTDRLQLDVAVCDREIVVEKLAIPRFVVDACSPAIVTWSSTIDVSMPSPPIILSVSVTELAVVDPELPQLLPKILRLTADAAAGTQLDPFQDKICPVVGALVEVSTSVLN